MDQGFVTWKVRSNPTLGEYLKENRLKQRLELKQVAQKLHINQKYLAALEQGNFSVLPGDVYVKGFVRSYASFLHLDVDSCVRMYMREKEIKKHVEPEEEDRGSGGAGKARNARVKQRTRKRASVRKVRNPLLRMTPRALGLGLLGAVVLFVGVYLWIQISYLATAPLLEIYEPSNDIVVKTQSVVVSGKTDPGSTVFLNGQSVFVDSEGRFSDQVNVQNGVNSLTVLARNKLNKETTVTRDVRADLPVNTGGAEEASKDERK